MSLDLALMIFHRAEGAEHAYSDVRQQAAGEPWLEEVAFVEHHRKDRLTVRGTVAGHYVDVDDHGDLIGPDVGAGAIAGAAVGALFGPAGFAAGMVAGGTAGGLHDSDAAARLHSAFLDAMRTDVPEGGSALALLAVPEHVDAMVASLANSQGTLLRHELTDEQAQALIAAVADAPSAA